jgi:hypothetical protein
MTGLSLDRAQDHFVLRRERPDGSKATISLNPLEILTLAEMVPNLRQQAFAMMYPSADRSTVDPIVAMDVFDFQLQAEVLQSKLLLMLRLGTTGSSTAAYAFSRSLADRLAKEISPLLAPMLEKPPTKQ